MVCAHWWMEQEKGVQALFIKMEQGPWVEGKERKAELDNYKSRTVWAEAPWGDG